jgi:pyruvate dehydrogenase E2 component (dihydrolipoyllysine-residue acetyltransferase)
MTDTPHPGGFTQEDLLDRVRLEGMRKAIARNMTESLREMAQLTLHRMVDTAMLTQFRTHARDLQPSINHLVLACVARVLTKHPSVNATLENDTISRWRCVHLGMAVAVSEGLFVPVVRNADTLSLEALGGETTRLLKLAREGRLTIADMQGATFTVSNLGGLGVDAFTPIINPPQVAILGVGRIFGGSMTLSLTIDHRALDGAPAAEFLRDLAEMLEGFRGLE